MRIWSINPKYLDTKGLVALWRETLLAKNVLENNTQGYKNHPQLTRFKYSDNPLHSLSQYMEAVYEESQKRGYHFNKEKFNIHHQKVTLTVTRGQIEYETQHLLKKLKTRDAKRYDRLLKETTIEPHPLFKIIDGEIEGWEIVKEKKDCQF
jgi:hypothetical protein